MNFPGEGSEEIKKLRKQLQQSDFRLSHLQCENQKNETQLTTLRRENLSLKQSYDAGESRIVLLEIENAKYKDDRERQKVAHSNLEQALQQTKMQLQGNEKDKRLFHDDSERNLERRARLAEGEAEAYKERCRILEEQVRGAQASDRFHNSSRRENGDPESKILALQNEILSLKGLLDHSQHTSPLAFRTGGPLRRPRSSSVSGSSSSDVHQLRETLNETVKEVEHLRTKATKAEKEALKASNEKLALSRLSETTIAELKSQVADLKDEVSFQRDNLLKKLEDEVRTLQGESAKALKLETELQTARSNIVQQETTLKAAQDAITTWRGTVDQLRVEAVQAREDGALMNEQLVTAEQKAKQLYRRDREIESAKKRIDRLSFALKKVLTTVTNDQAEGDETHSQSMITVDETTFANITTSNDYEADLVDEIDQLLGFVDEADGRVEFAKVERGILESNAINQRQELGRIIEEKEKELIAIKEERDSRIVEVQQQHKQMEEMEAKKEKIETRLQEALEKMQTVTSDNEALHSRFESLQEHLSTVERELKGAADDRLVMLDTIKMLEESLDGGQRQLADSEAEIERIQVDKEALQQQIADLKVTLQTSDSYQTLIVKERDDLASQVQKLKAEEKSLVSHFSEAKCTIEALEREHQQAELHAAKLSLDIHSLEENLIDQAVKASQRQADVLEQYLSALHLESKQWSSLVMQLRYDAEQSFLHLQSKEESWIKEADEYLLKVTALEAEVNMATEELQKKKALVDILELDLQAGRTNQQLAEDALKRLAPGRESDLTVVEDISSLDVSTEVNELNIQLDQTREALESSKRKQSARESDLAVAMEETEELKTELDKLDEQLNEAYRQKDEMTIEGQDLRIQLQATETLNREMLANLAQLDETLSSTMRQLAVTQNIVSELEATNQALEMEKKDQTHQSEAVKEELREAQEGYTLLKDLMESRNAEYWETKEELAEWQERFERSQNDVKVKDELEERFKEAVIEMNDAKALADTYLTKCTALEESVNFAQREVEESRSRSDSLEAELEQSRLQAAQLYHVEQQLGAASALIEQLEQDLAQKAQECEDADDKELALRKDNKKLGARVVALQARLDKLQLQGSTSKVAAVPSLQSSKAPVSQIRESGSAGSLGSVPSSASRKRRAPEDEEQAKQSEEQQPVTTRAIYAPKSATSLVKEVNSTKASNTLQPIQKTIVKKSSFPPSEILSNRMLKSPKKVGSSTLQDRTNLPQPRQVAAIQDTHFLTKLNRFRPPTIQVEAAPLPPS